MGKRFVEELKTLNATVSWAKAHRADKLRKLFTLRPNIPLISIGSGGSQTAAIFAALLAETNGNMGVSKTPYEFAHANFASNESDVLLLSAGGKNRDVLRAAEHAVLREHRNIVALCAATNSSLAKLANQYPIISLEDFDLPSGKDGFLATNTLLASLVLLASASGKIQNGDLRGLVWDHENEMQNASMAIDSPPETWLVIHGYWGKPAAWDFESKCSEAALGNVLVSDFRNFGHGRHLWIAKRASKTRVLAIVSPEDEAIWRRTVKKFPEEIAVHEVVSPLSGSLSSIDLLVKVFYLANALGVAQGIDPGRPGVPRFGSQLYRVSPPKMPFPIRPSMPSAKRAAVLRKNMKGPGMTDWNRKLEKFLKNLQGQIFSSIVFDYDGTLCSTEKRFDRTDSGVVKRICKLLDDDMVLGIATGRGRSAGDRFREFVPEKYWRNIYIGYYNGSQIASLESSSSPDREIEIDSILLRVERFLIKEFREIENQWEIRPHQISIPVNSRSEKEFFYNRLSEEVTLKFRKKVKIMSSGHSIDIIPSDVTKCAVVSKIETELTNRSLSQGILAIGDSGDLFGNDFELLGTEFSLSVDRVSTSSSNCWNLAPFGYRGIDATCFYLDCLEQKETGYNFNLKKGLETIR